MEKMLLQIISTLLLIAGLIVVKIMIKSILNRSGKLKAVPVKRIHTISTYFTVVLFFLALILISMIWSIDYKGLFVFASSAFAVVGVSLFAQWSVLSNITGSVIIFFTFPAGIGDTIKIIDGDNTITGEILEITLFQVLLKDPDMNIVSYPNNQLLQKPIKIVVNEISNIPEMANHQT